MSELYLIAKIAGRTVAMDAAQIESVVDIGEVTSVPLASKQVRGLAALRSRVVTVIDTQMALGVLHPSDSERAVITQLDGHHYAMLVDALEDVAAFQVTPLTAGVALAEEWRGAGLGLLERGGEPILLIDLTRLVPVNAAIS